MQIEIDDSGLVGCSIDIGGGDFLGVQGGQDDDFVWVQFDGCVLF